MTRSTPGSRYLRLLGVAGVTLVLAAGPAVPALAEDPVAPLVAADPATDVPGSYIVVLKKSADTGSAARRARRNGARVQREYRSALRGYSARLDPAALAEVRQDPDVAYVEPNQKVYPAATQTGAPWGLDRIDQDRLPLNGIYNSSRTGAGVTVYVIDSGIRADHVEFGGRVAAGANFVADEDPTDTSDCSGHGTHVAGIVGGATYGVAKAATLVPLRIFGCDGKGGDSSAVIAALDWVAGNRKGPAVVNMSFYGGPIASLDSAVQASVNRGVVNVAAAGNDAKDACNYSPARAVAAITVGASTSADAIWASSNTGSCVDLFAPGASIRSAVAGSDTATSSKSGTSMAAPYVAGAAALHLQANPSATNAQVRDAIVGQATAGVLPDAGGTANRLLFVANPAPVLWLARTEATAGSTVEVNSMTAASGWTRADTQATRFPVREAANGFWQNTSGNLWQIKFRNTGGYVEVHSATAASSYLRAGVDSATRFGAGEGDLGVMQMVGSDLWYVRLRGPKQIDVFSATAATGYAKGFALASNFPLGEAGNGAWQVANGNGDLWFVKTRNTASGSVEVRLDVVSGRTYLAGAEARTYLSVKEADNGRFVMVGEDLWFVKTRNTDSGRIELYSATKASGYQSGQQLVTSWDTADADNGAWSMF